MIPRGDRSARIRRTAFFHLVQPEDLQVRDENIHHLLGIQVGLL